MELDDILSRLPKAKKLNSGAFQAKCPSHDDRKESLSITFKSGKVLLYCHAGCSYESIMSALGYQKHDPSEIVFYDYVDKSGNLLFQSVKFTNPKDFRQRRPDGKGGWIWDLKGVQSVLYKLPLVNQAIQSGRIVFLVEGEKDVETLIRQGLIATTNPMGAGKWKPEYTDSLENGHVVIIPDNDEPGYKHAELVASLLLGKARSVKILKLDIGEFGNKKDVSDWMSEKGDSEQLKKLVKDTPVLVAQDGDGADSGLADLLTQDDSFFPLTDLGNAERFHAEHEQYAKYNYTLDKWLFWNGRNWEVDLNGKVIRFARQTVRNIQLEAAESTSREQRRAILKHAINSEASAKIKSMVDLAKSFVSIASTSDDYDTFHNLFNCQNGIYDLESMKFFQHEKNFQITKISKAHYQPDAKAPNFQSFLNKIFNSDLELIKFIQKSIGISLTGYTDEQVLCFAYGIGANGKSTFFEMVRLLLGDYFQKSPTEMLLAKNNDGGINNDVARLVGSRFVVAAELPSSKRLNEQIIKDLTGGDVITARFLHREFFEFMPTHKLWIYGNHKPQIRDTDEGIWRRVALIPFEIQIPQIDRIPQREILAKFELELSGILNWAIEGYRLYKEEGYTKPDIVQIATQKYRSESDYIGAFIFEICTVREDARVSLKQLYEVFGVWAEENKEYVPKKREFRKTLEERGFKIQAGTANKIVVQGIGVKEDTGLLEQANKKEQDDDLFR